MASVKPWGLRHFVLSNGVEIPCVGFGTFKIRGETNVRAAVSFAVGDVMTVTCPSPRDNTLSDVCLTVLGAVLASP